MVPLLRIIFISLLSIPLILQAQKYKWPTDASRAIASSFCEYRSGHFHAAIDIKTWNREGYKVFAIEDGRIVRITMSPFGAGKALYVKLKDGRTAVYFHLQKFTPTLEAEVRKEQRRQKSYSINWWPKNKYVKKGQLIAYTGQTGIGVPHLHFEVRDAQNRALNPLKFYKKYIKDSTAPTLKELLISPQDEKSTVNGSFLPQRFKLKYNKKEKYYSIPQPVYVKGRVGVALRGYDKADGFHNKLGYYYSELWLDGKKHFRSELDRLNFKQTRFIELDIDYPQKRRSGARFNRFYYRPYNPLDFYDRSLGNGIIEMQDKRRSFTLVAGDFYGNKSIVKGQFLVEEKPASATYITQRDSLAFLRIQYPKNIQSLLFYYGQKADSMHKVAYYEQLQDSIKDNTVSALVRLNLNQPNAPYFKMAYEQKGKIFSRLINISADSLTKSAAKFRLEGKYLHINWPDLAQNGVYNLKIEQPDTTLYDTLNGSEYVLPARSILNDSLRIKLLSCEEVISDTLIQIYKILPKKKQRFILFNAQLQIDTRANTAFDTLLFMATKHVSFSNADSLPVWGNGFKIDAGGRILNRAAKVSLGTDSTFLQRTKAAHFSLRKEDLRYKGGQLNPKTDFVESWSKTFGTYIVAADTVAPEIKNIKVSTNKKGQPTIRFKITDSISGVGSDKNIEVLFNNIWVVPEWDPETDIVRATVHFKPKAGKHTFKITIRDRARNAKEVTTIYKAR